MNFSSYQSCVENSVDFVLISRVVMEFPGITVGGGFSGTAGESSGIVQSKLVNRCWV